MDPLQIFDDFKLDTLDEKWSDDVWHREFLSFPEAPVEYSILLGSEDMESFLKETRNAVRTWIDQNERKDGANDQERVEVSWQTLTALNINIRGLLAVLGYLMKVGLASGADEDSRQACLASASLYFTLLSIPGSSTFHVFHPNLYQWAIETLKLSEHLMTKKPPKANDLESLYGYDNSDEMLQSEKITLIKGLNSVLFDLITMIRTFYMKYQASSLESTVICLVEVTKLETDINPFQRYSNKTAQASKASLSYNAYVALQDLCAAQHGDVKDIIRLILRYLMPHLTPNYLDLPAKAVNVVWDTIICFCRTLLRVHGHFAELGMQILIQHLLIKCPERSEPRQKQATTVSKLISICHGKTFLNLIENIIKFAFNNKIPSRIFAQEVIGKLITEMYHNMPENEITNRDKAKKILIATTFSRCVDSSSMVRGKAMSIIESIINNDKLKLTDFLNMSEEDKPFPSDEELIDAVESDSNPLPGPNTFSAVLLDRIKDERALVRRSALHALKDVVIHFPPQLEKVSPIIGRHCRDPAMTVRKDAILALASLLQSHPLNEKVLDEFIKAVLPRIFDVETKVQEKVLESMQNLVLDKISIFVDEQNDQTQLLPWKIINRVSKEKMRKNLSKICDFWVKDGVVTNALISKIQTHIGSDHDTEVWILLSTLAENTKLTNMKKYFEDYRKIFEGNDFLTTLKLEVLRHTWQSMGRDFLENVYQYLYKSLSKFVISLENIGMSIDILAGITKRLNASNGKDLMNSHMTDLIRFSEAKINLIPEENNEIDADQIDEYLKAMTVLGHASLSCTEPVLESTLSIIQSVLLDCDSIPKTVRKLERFKAIGIVVLSQQAMRDREFAEQVMPILGRLMCRSSPSETQAAIRINAVKALADLCIRFTALVEPYLPDMCISMKDPNAMVREVIVVIFVQLLLEDYIKVKGAFFYHILTMLSDSDETIRDLTIFLVKERLLIKNKSLISQSFVPSIFHYNNCQTKHKFNDRKVKKKEKDVLLLTGQKNEEKRRIIYDFMLEHLDPPSKLKILTKLNSEVFEGVCEKYINIKQKEGASVLKDVLYIISNDRMHASFGSKVQEDDLQDDTTAAENPLNNALNVIVEGMKRFKLSVMLPTLLRLRDFLLLCKSPLLLDLSRFFLKIISDFNKDQQAEIFEEHPNLKKDIDHDISMYENQPEEAMDNNTDEETESVNKPEEAMNNNTDEETESVNKPEETSNCSLNKKDVNANISIKKDKSKEQKSGASTPIKIQSVQFDYVPRIVLRRLSTLTYPGVKEWKSPPRDTKSQTTDSAMSGSSGMSDSSKSPSEVRSVSSLDLFDPEISSTPKPRKIAKLSKETLIKS